MARKHVAVASIAVSLCTVLAASCAQDTASQPTETKDDDGDVGSDPDTSGSVGGVPAWNYNWSAPTCNPSAGDGDPDPDPPPDTSGGYGPSPAGRFPARPPVRPPAVMPLAPCEHECQANYEDMAANCGSMESAADRNSCAAAAYASYKSCRETCKKNSGDDCLEQCKKLCDELCDSCIGSCMKKPKGKRSDCIGQCRQEHGRCLHECDRKCK